VAPLPVFQPRVDGDGDADQGNGNRHRAQGARRWGPAAGYWTEVSASASCRNIHPSRIDRGVASGTATAKGAAFSRDFALAAIVEQREQAAPGADHPTTARVRANADIHAIRQAKSAALIAGLLSILQSCVAIGDAQLPGGRPLTSLPSARSLPPQLHPRGGCAASRSRRAPE
jgi:hypothetical protein